MGKAAQGSFFLGQQKNWLAVLAAAVVPAYFVASAAAGLFDGGASSQQNAPPSTQVPPAPPATPVPDSTPTDPPAVSRPVVPASKLPLPTEAAQQAAEKSVNEIFEEDVAKARLPSDWAALALRFRETGISTTEPATRFVLFHDAEGFAVKGNDIDDALAAHGELVKGFYLGTSRVVTEVFQKLDRTSNATELEKLCRAMSFALEDSLATDQYDAARQIGRLATATAGKLGDREISNSIASSVATISTREAEQKRITPAMAALAANPNDAQASAAVGRYFCFVKRDWAKGLPLLVKGNDPSLKQLANRELAVANDAGSQTTLADSWWTYSESQPPAIRESIRVHAGHWYSQASAGLQGLDKLKAQKRAADYLESVRLSTPNSPAPDAPAAESNAPDVGYTSVLQILQAVPQNLFPPTLAQWNDQHRNAVNDALKQQVVGRTGTFQVTVETMNHSPKYLNTRNQIVRLGQFTAKISTTFDPDKTDLWPSIVNRGTYLVTGRIFVARFQGTELSISMSDCHVVTQEELAQNAKKPAAPANPTDAGKPVPAPAAPGITQLKSVEQILAAAPVQTIPVSSEQWHDPEITKKFTDAFGHAFQHTTVNAPVKIIRIDTTSPDETYARTDWMPLGPTKLSLAYSFKPSDPQLTDLEAGQTYTIAGRISRLSWGPAGLTFAITGCKLVKSD